MPQDTPNFTHADVDHICTHVTDIKTKANKLFTCNKRVAEAGNDLPNHKAATFCRLIIQLIKHAETTSKFFDDFLTCFEVVEESNGAGPRDDLSEFSVLQGGGVGMLGGLKTLRENYLKEVEVEQGDIGKELEAAGFSFEKNSLLERNQEVDAIYSRLKI